MPLLALSALLLLLFVSQLFTRRNNTLLTRIESSFVPALELGHDLERTLIDIQRSMQDAVAAADKDELALADTFYNEFLQLFEEGRANTFFEAENLDALVVVLAKLRNGHGVAPPRLEHRPRRVGHLDPLLAAERVRGPGVGPVPAIDQGGDVDLVGRPRGASSVGLGIQDLGLSVDAQE